MSGSSVTNSSGLVFAMLDVIAEKLNFTYITMPPADNQIGNSRSHAGRLRHTA